MLFDKMTHVRNYYTSDRYIITISLIICTTIRYDHDFYNITPNEGKKENVLFIKICFDFNRTFDLRKKLAHDSV